MLAITAGRFQIADGRLVKSQHSILPDQTLQLRVFLNGECDNVTQLNSFVVHLGEVPSSGHYLAVMLTAEAGMFHVSDDHVPMRALHERELEMFHKNSYVFFYSCAGRE